MMPHVQHTVFLCLLLLTTAVSCQNEGFWVRRESGSSGLEHRNDGPQDQVKPNSLLLQNKEKNGKFVFPTAEKQRSHSSREQEQAEQNEDTQAEPDNVMAHTKVKAGNLLSKNAGNVEEETAFIPETDGVIPGLGHGLRQSSARLEREEPVHNKLDETENPARVYSSGDERKEIMEDTILRRKLNKIRKAAKDGVEAQAKKEKPEATAKNESMGLAEGPRKSLSQNVKVVDGSIVQAKRKDGLSDNNFHGDMSFSKLGTSRPLSAESTATQLGTAGMVLGSNDKVATALGGAAGAVLAPKRAKSVGAFNGSPVVPMAFDKQENSDPVYSVVSLPPPRAYYTNYKPSIPAGKVFYGFPSSPAPLSLSRRTTMHNRIPRSSYVPTIVSVTFVYSVQMEDGSEVYIQPKGGNAEHEVPQITSNRRLTDFAQRVPLRADDDGISWTDIEHVAMKLDNTLMYEDETLESLMVRAGRQYDDELRVTTILIPKKTWHLRRDISFRIQNAQDHLLAAQESLMRRKHKLHEQIINESKAMKFDGFCYLLGEPSELTAAKLSELRANVNKLYRTRFYEQEMWRQCFDRWINEMSKHEVPVNSLTAEISKLKKELLKL